MSTPNQPVVDPSRLPASGLLPSTLVEDLTRRVGALAGERAAAVFARALTETPERTLTRRGDGTAFVVTGDIPAMWLRDSTAQWQPYLLLLPEAPGLAEVLGEVVRSQFAAICHDPYANAVNDGPTGACYEPGDNSDDPRLWERKYEVDSLAFPVLLAHRLWRATGGTDHLDDVVLLGLRRTVQLWRREQHHERDSSYRFVRPSRLATETLARDGLGGPVAVTGLTWSGFRPSDDACRFGYNIPANLFAARSLDRVVELAREVFADDQLATEAADLAAGIRAGLERFGLVEHPEHGPLWAYEVDGLGGCLLADDANAPSLLSLPLLGVCPPDDPRYLATRALVLSEENPWYWRGAVAAGVGSPHTPDGYVWPIALAVEGLTSTDPQRPLELLRLLAETDDGTTRMHEGFHVDDPSRWTREWFSWADAAFCELALALLGRRVTDLDRPHPTGPDEASRPDRTAVRRRDLGTECAWEVRPVDGEAGLAAMPAEVVRPDALPGPVPATVPGAVQLDLMGAGLLPDPLTGLNEARVQWVGRLDWEYETSVEVAPDQLSGRSTLLLDGLDTVASVHVGERCVHRSENMHRSWRVDVTDVLQPGPNRLRLRFDSALVLAERRQDELGTWPNDYPHPYNQVRKHASSFGWDWGPTVVGVGPWRPVRLEHAPQAALARLQVRGHVAESPAPGTRRAGATLHVVADVELAGTATGTRLQLAVRGPHGHRLIDLDAERGRARAVLDLPVADAELWFPTGYGPAVLHDVDVDLLVDGRVVDHAHRRTGFRHVDVDTGPDVHGRAFVLRVNGVPVFVKGFNWIPDDPFPTRTTAREYVQRLEQARAANANLVRVWGGGLFEDEVFYRACDERGLLVWQDLLLACAGYPELEPLASEIAAESREAVARLSAHPSVVVWNGGNENLLGYSDWGWQARLDGRPWGERYAREVFPALVAELHPGAVYLVNSPHSTSERVTPNFPGEGTTHQWDTWNRLDHRHYRDTVPRFAAEYGWQAPATLPTLRRALDEDALQWDSEQFLAHQKQTGGGRRLVERLEPMVADVEALLVPEAFADFHLATSLNQAHALRTAVEHLRSWWPRSAGSIIWQLNDCWPVSSWAVLDGDGVPKLGWYAARAAYADRIVTVQPREDGLAVVLVNDTDQTWTAPTVVSRRDLDGTTLDHHELALEVAPRSVVTRLLPAPLVAPWRQRRELLVAEVAGLPGGAAARSCWRFVDQSRLELGAGALRAEVGPVRPDGGVPVRVVATEACLDVVLLVELVDPAARVDTALVTLFPGEQHEFVVTGLDQRETQDLQRLLAPEVLRWANQVARP